MPRTRYELRKTSSGWTVVDRALNMPAAIDAVWQVGFQLKVAEFDDGAESVERPGAYEGRRYMTGS